MNEIVEYISYVDPIVTHIEVPKYPIYKESHFNFLKPGSKEVLTRPVHIHEHLPPINPQEEETAYTNGEKEIDVVGVPSEDVFKRPAEADINPAKKAKLEQEEGRATREITSVMMTTSGFISPAREGKLPEAKPPKLPDEFPKPIPPPKISPPSSFKTKDPFGAGPSGIDKKLEKKLKKKNHDKEKKKEKQHRDKYPPPSDELAQYDPIPHHQLALPPMPPNEQMLAAERKKELKKLKMKTKDETKKSKKEKPPKNPKMHSFESGFMDNKPIIDPYQVLPSNIPQPPPPTSSTVQAHKYLTGAAPGLFPTNLFEQSTFGSQPQQPLLSAQNPLIEGKLVSEPDKQKLNIFKKISKPKEDPVKHQPLPPQMDFLTPSKLDRFDSSQPTTSFTDPIKKMHKLPKETTLTRVNDDSLNVPMNLSGLSRSNDSSFEESVPKTPTMPPKTPDFKFSQSQGVDSKKEKKERKKKEKKHVEANDWLQQQQQTFPNPFDLSSQNNSFLQSLQTGGLMGNLASSLMMNRNPFMPSNDLFSSGPGLIPKAPFGGMQQSPLNSIMNPYGMDVHNIFQPQPQPKPKKVKPQKHPKTTMDDLIQMGSKFCNVAPLIPASIIKDRFEPQLMNLDTFPLQQQALNTSSTFDQLLKESPQPLLNPAKKFLDDKVETFDLTKDSSPEPSMSAPMPSTSASSVPLTPSLPTESPLPTIPENAELPPVVPKEKNKEKKKKKDKDREKDRDKDKEERKKVSKL